MAAKEPKPKRPPKTFKERKFVKEYIKNGGNATQSALVAYNTNPVSARQIGSETLAKLDMSSIMERNGLTDDYLVTILSEGLIATKQMGAMVQPGDGKDASSATYDFVDVPDYAVRHKYLDTGLKLKGHMNPEIMIQNQINNTYEKATFTLKPQE